MITMFEDLGASAIFDCSSCGARVLFEDLGTFSAERPDDPGSARAAARNAMPSERGRELAIRGHGQDQPGSGRGRLPRLTTMRGS